MIYKNRTFSFYKNKQMYNFTLNQPLIDQELFSGFSLITVLYQYLTDK